MNVVTVLIIVLVLLLIGVLPGWPHTQALGWGYGAPIGMGTIILIILIVLLLRG